MWSALGWPMSALCDSPICMTGLHLLVQPGSFCGAKHAPVGVCRQPPCIPDTCSLRFSAPSASLRYWFLPCVETCVLLEEAPDASQHLRVHCRRQQSGLRILLAWMVNAEQVQSRRREIYLRAVRE